MSKQLDKLEELVLAVVKLGRTMQRLFTVERKLDQLLHLLKDMVALEGHIDEVEESILSRLDKLAASQVDSSKLVDRLIEMSMVNRGQSQDAVVHRAQARVESNFSDVQSWTPDEQPEDVWPPKGCDAVDIQG
jgi:hypothetical protein